VQEEEEEEQEEEISHVLRTLMQSIRISSLVSPILKVRNQSLEKLKEEHPSKSYSYR
jgi:hypothetical protein